MVTLNPVKRVKEAGEAKENRAFDVPAGSQFHVVSVGWHGLEEELNYWHSHGWDVKFIKDGVTIGLVNRTELGCTVVLERRAA